MIALLRVGSFLVNLAVFGGLPLALGAGWFGAGVCALACFALCWWACGLHPRGESARPESLSAAREAVRLLDAAEPEQVLECEGWVAAAVRSGRGYALLLGREIAPGHRTAVLAHEVAHVRNGDLFWEPLTDGPGRLLLSASARMPPLVVAAVPFLLLGAPLARATELRADATALRAMPSYPAVLQEVAELLGGRRSLLYPSLRTRVRLSARDSLNP
jgi:hypothetical protein